MKKIYTIKTLALGAFVLMANAAMGQNLKVTSNGKPVADGDVINLNYEIEDFSDPDAGFYWITYTWDPHLEVATAEGTASLSVTMTSLENTSGFQLCWPMGCQAPKPGESVSSSGTINTTPQDLLIHKAVDVEEKDVVPEGGSVSVRIVSGSETVTVTVNALVADNAVGENFADITAPTVFYTLQGVKVENPGKGIYVAKKGAKSRLIYNK